MTALALNLRLDRSAVMRAALAGIAWGLIMTVALLGMAYAQCGLTCDLDVATTAAISLGTGLVAIGPLALVGRRPAP